MAKLPVTKKLPLTKQRVEAIVPPATGESIVWDDRLTGFAVRVSSTGRRTYFVQRRTSAGRQLKMRIGAHGVLTADQARKLAAVELGKLAAGADPAADRSSAREQEVRRRAIPTVADVGARYLEEHARRHKRPSSAANDEAMLQRYVLPAIGNMRVPDVRRADVAALHRSIERRYMANRVLSLVSKMFSLCVVEWELRSDNPARGIKRNLEESRERYLDDNELGRLAKALDTHPSQVAASAIKLLLLTGARRMEVLAAQWSEFDLEAGVWTKPSSRTKQRRSHRLPLAEPARALLSEIKRREGDRLPYVFPGRGDGPMTDIKKAWAVVCKSADLRGVRLHDLRHTHASLLASAGESLPVIGALLGHSEPSTTAKYAHLIDRAMRRATEGVAAKLGGLVP